MNPEYTIQDALELARILKHGPLPKNTDPLPSIPEARTIIRDAWRKHGGVWITAERALEALNTP